MNRPIHPFDFIEQAPVRAAVGHVRRVVDGNVTDDADFIFLSPARWRVRQTSGEEIVSDGPHFWQRADASSDWKHSQAENGAGVYHTGYLRVMLFPTAMPSLADAASRVVREESRDDATRRLWVSYVEPVEGTMVVDLSSDGRLLRLASDGEESQVEIELTADYGASPRPDLFHPTSRWASGGDG